MSVLNFPGHEAAEPGLKVSDWLRRVADKIDQDYPGVTLNHGVLTFVDDGGSSYFYNTPGATFELRAKELWALEDAKLHLMGLTEG